MQSLSTPKEWKMMLNGMLIQVLIIGIIGHASLVFKHFKTLCNQNILIFINIYKRNKFNDKFKLYAGEILIT